jgi:alpha-L-rhamnosidase
MIREGATTIWERWEKLTNKGMNSHNHIMFGTVDAWFYKALAGILPDSPGFKKITIKPVVPEGLNYASASIKSIYGMISSRWQRDDSSFKLEVEIPVNTTACVMLPKLNIEGGTVAMNGQAVDADAIDVRCNNNEEYYAFEIGSGCYAFEIKEND